MRSTMLLSNEALQVLHKVKVYCLKQLEKTYALDAGDDFANAKARSALQDVLNYCNDLIRGED